MARRFDVDLMSLSSLQKLAKDLEDYQRELQVKCTRLVNELAKIGITVIDKRMADAQIEVDGYSSNKKGTPIVSGADTSHHTERILSSSEDAAQIILQTSGKELLFIEFGSGVYYNGAVGSSPHPKGPQFGFLIGFYGKGHGKQKIWGYYDDSGQLVLTHGVEATMPMYNAYITMFKEVEKIAIGVFA